VREGARATVVAVGPTLDNVLAATAGLDVTVLYASTVRPFDHRGLRAAGHTDVVLVESYLAGTSAHEVAIAFDDVGHRLRALGVRRDIEVRAYGVPEEHDAVHGLGAEGIATVIRQFIR
jgi:transketolase